MKTTAISFLLLVLPAFLLADDKKDPELVKVYCFSEEIEAGFKDDFATYFCKELGKRGDKKSSLVLEKDRTTADVIVQFTSSEPATVQGTTTFASSGYAWTPERVKVGSRAVVTVGDFAKEFHTSKGEPSWRVEEWIRNNRETILKKAQ